MPDSRRVLLVGWDAADWKIIHPLMDAGHMPTIRRLVEGGVMGSMATLSPALSPMLWTSIATGKRPFKHGIYGFTEPAPDGKSVQPMTNTTRRCKAIWNILNQQGMQSIVVGWWPSHPAEPINGVMVSDYYHKTPRRPGEAWPLMPSAVHPQRCVEEIRSLRLHPSEIQAEHILAFVPRAAEIDQESDPRLSVCMRIFCECTTIHAAATHLMETEPWDFMAVYYDAIDHFCHGFMKYHPPKQDYVSESDFRTYQHVVTAGYIYHDMMLNRLLELAGEDTTVVLISDHGFHPDYLRPQMIPAEPAGPAAEHRDYGIFVMNGPGIRSDHVLHGAGLLDVTPTILTVYGLPTGEDMDGRPLREAFEQPPEIRTIETWEQVPGEDGQHSRDFRMDPAEAKEALEQLIALGYVERPDDDAEKAVAQCTRELDYNLARSWMDAGMYGKAVPLLARLYREHPVEFRFGIQLANCLHAMGRHRDLKRLIDDLNARWRVAQEEARKKLAEVGRIAKKRKEQWDEFRRIDEENRDDPANPPMLARLSPTGRPVLFTEMEMHFVRKLRAVARGNAETLDFLAATVAIAEGDLQTALEMLERAELTRSPNPAFQFHVGNVYLGLDRLDDAGRAYRRALERDEFHPNGYLGLCRVSLKRGEHEQALEYGRRAVGLKFHLPPAHYFLGQAKEALADVEGAICSYETALAQNPNFVEAHQALARLYEDEESVADADRAQAHRTAARDLSWERAKLEETSEPLDFLAVDAEALREELPQVPPEEFEHHETFRRCLAQPPMHTGRDGRDGQIGARATVTVVSGLPRSGTSAMMQMLVATGKKAFTDHEREADENNPKGYFEAELVKRLPHRNDWVEGCDGQVVKIVAQLIPYLPQGIDYRIIFMDRDLQEILDSQTKMLQRLDHAGGNIERERLALVFRQQIHFVFNLMTLHRVPVLKLPYPELVADPASAAQRVAEFLEEDLDVEAMASAVDPDLYRERASVS